MPLGLGHALAVAPDPGVIGADDDVLELLLLEGLLQNGMEQGARFPGRAREDFVVGRPVLLRVAVKTDGARNGAPAHAAQNAKGQRDGPSEAALLWAKRSRVIDPATEPNQRHRVGAALAVLFAFQRPLPCATQAGH